MKQNTVVKFTLIAALIAGSIIPSCGYIVLMILLLYLTIKGELKDVLRLAIEEKSILFALVYIMFSLLRSNYKIDSLIAVLGIIIVILLYLVIRRYVNSVNDTIDIFKFFVFSNIIISAYGIMQFYFIKNPYFATSWVDSKVYNISMRAYSSLLNPNVLAAYLVFYICIQLTSLENIKSRKISFFSIVLSSFCLILTYSRGAWVSLFIIVFLLYMHRQKVVYLLYSFTLLVSITLVNGRFGIERLNINKSLHDNSMLYRLEIYKSTLKIIKENLLFGTGLNTMKHYVHRYSQVITVPVDHAHNLILQILGETGFVGLIIFGIIVLTLIKNLYYIYRLEDDLYRDIALSGFLGFLSILIHGFIDAPIFAPQFLFFTIYIYSFISNIKYMENSLNKPSEPCSNSRKNSGGELYGTRDTSFKKGYNRA
ncbi:O-antigen ligase family protein [Wukongibacter baidiensis]|uniref:O-antigen ligase family protein n=1 Tax=Wukongibacter baidiensis TaxID=1723361 RepID=UPI003D7FC5CB